MRFSIRMPFSFPSTRFRVDGPKPDRSQEYLMPVPLLADLRQPHIYPSVFREASPTGKTGGAMLITPMRGTPYYVQYVEGKRPRPKRIPVSRLRAAGQINPYDVIYGRPVNQHGLVSHTYGHIP